MKIIFIKFSIVLIGFSFLFFVFYILFLKDVIKNKKRKNNGMQAIKAKKGNGKNKFYFLFSLYRKLPIINESFRKLRLRVESLYPADTISINKKATGIMTAALGVSTGYILFSVLFAREDIFYICCGLTISVVAYNYVINTKLQNTELTLLSQLRDFVIDLRNAYNERPIPEDALSEAINLAPYEIGLHMEKVNEIITVTDEKKKNELLEIYNDEAPISFFIDLIMLLTTIEFGDKEIDGKSTFMENLNNLQENIDQKLLDKQDIKDKFSMLAGCCLAGIPFVKLVEGWASKTFNIQSFYNSIQGKACMVLIFVITYVCYIVVETLKNTQRGRLIENSIFKRIASIPGIRYVLNKEVNKYYSKADALNDDMKKVGDLTGPNAFIVKSVFCGLIVIAFSTLLFFTSEIKQKYDLIHKFGEAYSDTLVPTEEYKQIMETSSKNIMKLYAKEKNIDKEALIKEIEGKTDVKNYAYADMIANEIIIRASTYQNTYYRWYYLLFSLFFFAAGCTIPYIYLLFKIKVIDMEQENEVNQFISIVLMLMYTSGVTSDVILEWMERTAYCFKNTISECLLEINMDEWQAIENMKEKEKDCGAFVRFCTALQNVEKVGIVKAFNSAVKDRSFNMAMQSKKTAKRTNSRSAISSIVAMIPIMSLICIYVVVPVVMLASNMMKQIQNIQL